ncbi:unnamed protein product [Peniophora sp. CBMAI 1063]|nr:unnamed protein product [Peniophora sp. CBMAI 1063]
MFSLTKVATFALFALGVAASTVPAKRQSSEAATILNDLAETITPIAAELGFLTPANASILTVTPIVTQMNAMMVAAQGKLAALPAGSAASDKTATIKALANVFTASLTPGNKLVATPGVSAVTIVPIFTQIGITLAALLADVVTLVEEVLTVVVDLLDGLIAGLEATLTDLGLTGLTAMGF